MRMPQLASCIALSIAVSALAIPTVAPSFANGGDVVAVTIAGDVSVPGFVVQVEAQARGPASALKGQGSDTPRTPPSGNNPGICTFPLTGSVTGTVVSLSGTVTFSTDASLIGVPVSFTADASNGSITFDFGGFILTGTGTVAIK